MNSTDHNFNPLVNGGDYVGTLCCICGEPKEKHMNITQRAAIVLQQIDAALALAEKAKKLETLFSAPEHASFIAASRTLLPTSLRCLKTAIDGLLGQHCYLSQCFCGCTTANEAGDRDICNRCIALDQSEQSLTTLCDQWEAGR